ncbi:hypothetical protein YC2023_045428 [Brassica napus]
MTASEVLLLEGTVIANRFGVYGSCGVPGWRFLAFGLFGSPMTPPLYRWWSLFLLFTSSRF